jgi:hypothetical protein
MRIAIRPAGLWQSPAIVESRFRRIPEGPSAVVAGQGQGRNQFGALSTRNLEHGFWTKHRRDGIRLVRIRHYVMEHEGIFRRFDILVHSDSLSFRRYGVAPDSNADLGRIAFM